jgi:hypothetical protein
VRSHLSLAIPSTGVPGHPLGPAGPAWTRLIPRQCD